ncbi:MAG: acyltransferase, partial [Mycobacterium sp.]
LDLAQVPFERVVELAPSLSRPRPLFSQVNFFDALAGPLAMLTKMFEGLTMGAYSDGRFTYPLSTIVGRFDETTVSVLFPNNPVARESIAQYLTALKSVCVRAADGWTPSRVRNPAELSQQPAY